MNYKYLFLDMNAYFASVEQNDNPCLRGLPVAVTPYTGKTGCVIAASYEAKDKGVKTGDRVGEARQKCPAINIVEARAYRYYDVHQKIRSTLDSFSPWVAPHSIDEFCITLDRRERNLRDATRLARDIKSAIKSRVGECLRCSAGVGPNMFLAKLATDLRKPDGFLIITLENSPTIFAQINDLIDICGINRASCLRLQRAGIYNGTDLFNATSARLCQIFKRPGERWYLKLHGYDAEELHDPPKSVGHSYVLEPTMRTHEYARPVIHKLAIKVAKRLKDNCAQTQLVYVFVGSFDRAKRHAHAILPPTNNTALIANTALRLYDDCSVPRPAKIGVVATRLIHSPSTQLTLFEDTTKAYELDIAMRLVNQKWGSDALAPASLYMVQETAPYRIAFNALYNPHDVKINTQTSGQHI